MRDPGLVQRAERAALALERAWEQWRSERGVGAENPTPVSSYVGYSLEEPWGEPRVVFGLGAEEAEMLAAVIDGHDYIGPVHANLTDWRLAAGSQLPLPAASQFSPEGRVAVPVQARFPAESARSADEPVRMQEAAVLAGHEPVVQEPDERAPAEEQRSRQSRLAQPVIAARRPDGEHDVVPAEVVPLEQLVPLPPAQTDGPYNASSQGPGYGGPGYEGLPLQEQAEAEQPYSDAGAGNDAAAGFAGGQPDRAASVVLSKLGRSRRSQRGAQETRAWAQEKEHQPTRAADTAV
jgi:hypothetical protein